MAAKGSQLFPSLDKCPALRQLIWEAVSAPHPLPATDHLMGYRSPAPLLEAEPEAAGRACPRALCQARGGLPCGHTHRLARSLPSWLTPPYRLTRVERLREAHSKDRVLELDPSTAAQQRTPTLEVKHCSSLTERSRAIAETFIVVDWVMTAGGGRGSCNISGVK